MVRVIIFILLMSPVSAFATSCDNLPFFSFEGFDGVDYAFYAKKQLLSDVPKWDSSNIEPPLSIGEARKIAERWATKSGFKLTIFRVTLEKRDFYCESLSGHWVYLFHFVLDKEGHIKHEGFKSVGVLMNGELLLPEVKLHSSGS